MHHPTLVRKDVFQLAELATAVRQTVTANQLASSASLRERASDITSGLSRLAWRWVQEGLQVFSRMRAA